MSLCLCRRQYCLPLAWMVRLSESLAIHESALRWSCWRLLEFVLPRGAAILLPMGCSSSTWDYGLNDKQRGMSLSKSTYLWITLWTSATATAIQPSRIGLALRIVMTRIACAIFTGVMYRKTGILWMPPAACRSMDYDSPWTDQFALPRILRYNGCEYPRISGKPLGIFHSIQLQPKEKKQVCRMHFCVLLKRQRSSSIILNGTANLGFCSTKLPK